MLIIFEEVQAVVVAESSKGDSGDSVASLRLGPSSMLPSHFMGIACNIVLVKLLGYGVCVSDRVDCFDSRGYVVVGCATVGGCLCWPLVSCLSPRLSALLWLAIIMGCYHRSLVRVFLAVFLLG